MRFATITLVLTGLTLTGCGGWAPEAEPREEELVLRGYAAPGQAESLASAIGSMLRLGERRVGSALVGPGDQLLVLAPRSVHANLPELIRATSDTGSAAEPASIAMTYWFVAARPGARPAPVAARLKEIEPALDEITRVQGPHEFRLIERIQLRETPGSRGNRGRPNARSHRVVIQQMVSISDGDIVAWVEAEGGYFEIDTSIRLQPTQLLVLAQVALDPRQDPFPPSGPTVAAPPREAAAPAPPAETALYLVIRADVDPPS